MSDTLTDLSPELRADVLAAARDYAALEADRQGESALAQRIADDIARLRALPKSISDRETALQARCYDLGYRVMAETARTLPDPTPAAP